MMQIYKSSPIQSIFAVMPVITDEIPFKAATNTIFTHFTAALYKLMYLYYSSSRPITYAKVSLEFLDGKEHNMRIRFIASEELMLNSEG